MPSEDTPTIGHKYPFNACEILCSANGLNINKLMSLKKEVKVEENKDNEEKNENKENDENLNDVDNLNDDIKDFEEKKEDVEEKKDENAEEKNENAEEKKEENEVEKKEENVEEKKENEEEKKENEEEKKENVEEKKEENVEEKKVNGEEKNENAEEKKENEEEKKEENEKEKKEENEEEKKEDDEIGIVHNIFDYLFKFLDIAPSEDNYVLMGYFAKLVNNLLKDKPEILLGYIFNKKPEIIQKMIIHINRKAIGNTIENFILNLNDDIFLLSNDYIIKICKSLIEGLNNVETDERGVEVICDLLINSMVTSSKNNLSLFLNAEGLMEKLEEIIEKFMNEKKDDKVTYLLKLLIKINDTLLKDFENKVTKNFTFDETENEIINIIRSIDRGGSAYDALTNKSDFSGVGTSFLKKNPERLIKLIDKNM